jgi:hypothetical protein
MFKIEVIVRVINQHGDVVDPTGRPAMHPKDHTVRHEYPEAFVDAKTAHSELAAAAELFTA